MFSAFSLSVILTIVRFGPAEVPPVFPPDATAGITASSPVAVPADRGGGAAAVPEPTTLLLVGGGLVGLALARRRRRS